MSRWARPGLAVLVILVGVLGRCTAARAAAPRVMLIYGPGLPRTVVLANWWDNQEVFQGEAVNVDEAHLAGQPFLAVALFWGAQWDAYVASGRPLNALTPDQATQHGRLYLAAPGARGLLLLQPTGGTAGSIRMITAAGAQVLAQAGINLAEPYGFASGAGVAETGPELPSAGLGGGAGRVAAGSSAVGHRAFAAACLLAVLGGIGYWRSAQHERG